MSEAGATSLAEVVRHGDRLTMERLVLFTDAVFAILITLLALEIRLPEHARFDTSEQVLDAIKGTVPRLFAYALGFVVVATFWRIHLRRYRYLVAIDGRVVAGNLVQLVILGLLPFATSVIASVIDSVAVTLYASIILASTVASWYAWRRAARDPALAGPEIDDRIRIADDVRTAITVVTFAASIALAWRDPLWAMLSWLLLLPANAIASRSLRPASPALAATR